MSIPASGQPRRYSSKAGVESAKHHGWGAIRKISTWDFVEKNSSDINRYEI
jgi:hypothetical protein